MDNSIPEYQITEQDYQNAKLILNKLGETQWRLKDLLLEAIRKYAHLSELANTLKYLPALEDEQEAADDINREAQFLFESTLSTFAGFTQRFKTQEEKLHKHMYALGQAFRRPVVAQCVCDEQKDGKDYDNG